MHTRSRGGIYMQPGTCVGRRMRTQWSGVCALVLVLVLAHAPLVASFTCPPGQYASGELGNTCSNCPAKTPHSHEGSTSASACFCAFGICKSDWRVDEMLGEYRDAAGGHTDVEAHPYPVRIEEAGDMDEHAAYAWGLQWLA